MCDTIYCTPALFTDILRMAEERNVHNPIFSNSSQMKESQYPCTPLYGSGLVSSGECSISQEGPSQVDQCWKLVESSFPAVMCWVQMPSFVIWMFFSHVQLLRAGSPHVKDVCASVCACTCTLNCRYTERTKQCLSDEVRDYILNKNWFQHNKNRLIL